MLRSFLALALLSCQMLAADEDDSLSPALPAGMGSADAANTALSISMVGWGIGIAAAIALLVILVPPDLEGTVHAHGD